MHPFPINYANQNQGYYVFIHEDSSPVDAAPDWSGNNNDGLEWDEELEQTPFPANNDDTWSPLYGWYAKMLEETDSLTANSGKSLKEVIKQVDTKQRGAAHYAAEQGHAGVIRLLLQTDCKIDTGDTCGYTPLHLAVRCGHAEATQVLLEARVNPNRSTLNSDRLTALHIAAAFGHPHIVDILVSAGAALEIRDGSERTPLQVAVEVEPKDAAIRLIKHGANCNIEDVRGYTPLCIAVWEGAIELVSSLLAAGARIPPHQYLLHHAVMHSQSEIVKLLVNHGLNINLRDESGDTSLLLAVRSGNTSIARLLLENGASVDYPNSLTGSTALHEAVSCSSDFVIFKEIFTCLQEYSVDLNAISFSGGGDTPLFRAILLERDQAAELLIRYGADVNLCSLQHCIVDNLSLAISRQSTSVAQMLVLAGASPPLEWRYGPRPLSHIARIVLRSSLPSKNLPNSINKLPLPVLLKRFLMFEYLN